jgi:hypothetical protein
MFDNRENNNSSESLEFSKFSPIAYFDKHMDCVRVVLWDDSMTEVRINEHLTLYRRNFISETEAEHKYVGFAIKGIFHAFDGAGLEKDRVYELADILTAISKAMPYSVMESTMDMVDKMFENNLRVKFDYEEDDNQIVAN